MQTKLTLRRTAPEAEPGLTRRILDHLRGRVIHPLRQIALAFEPCRIPAPVLIPVRRPRVIAKVLAPMLALTLCSFAPAARASHPEYVADGRLVDVEVLVDGSTAPLYAGPDGWDRRYFQAFRGRNYSLAVTNKTGQRVGVLIAVDGLNVVNGERSSLSNGEAMYVLGPWERAVIRGWRTSLRDVRRFVFVDEARSYAERTGQANGDMGWIRVLSFREQRPQVWIDPRFRPGDDRRNDGDEVQPEGAEKSRTEGERAPRSESAPAPSNEPRMQAGSKDGALKQRADSFHGAPESNPGTGWGEQRWDPVQRTVFLAASRATDQIVLRYEYESGLRALGIFPRRHRTWERERGELGWGFAQTPRW